MKKEYLSFWNSKRTRPIKLGQCIDFYVVYYPTLLIAYYQLKRGQVPHCEPLASTPYAHIQIVIARFNDYLASKQRPNW